MARRQVNLLVAVMGDRHVAHQKSTNIDKKMIMVPSLG